MRVCALLLCCIATAVPSLMAQDVQPKPSPYAQWKNGPSSDKRFFPIAVWLQDPKYASQYKAAGINIYFGLWKGPTEEQLAELTRQGMPVICSQNEVGLRHRDDKIIVAWMHGDEPDNAQELPAGQKGYGPPISPGVIINDYARMRKADPSRPVILNLGQGVAYDNYIGRGVRRNHPEDYLEYVKGGDIVSFDIYPVCHDSAEVKGKLWYVGQGVSRLRQWGGRGKVVWNVIECTRIGGERTPTPEEIRSEVWMSLIHGSMGITYFVHSWAPKFDERALLHDPVNLAAVTAINKRIQELAPVLNSPTIEDGGKVSSSHPDCPVDIMVKRHEGATYVFAAAMREHETRGTFEIRGLKTGASAEVLDEARSIPVRGGKFSDDFKGYGVHFYRIR